MAVIVVDRFEPIEIEKMQSDKIARTPELNDLVVEQFAKRKTVCKAGKDILARQVRELDFGQNLLKRRPIEVVRHLDGPQRKHPQQHCLAPIGQSELIVAVLGVCNEAEERESR